MNTVHLLRFHCSAEEEVKKKRPKFKSVSENRLTASFFFVLLELNEEAENVSYLDVSGVSLEDAQTQDQEKELLSEAALHDARECACRGVCTALRAEPLL